MVYEKLTPPFVLLQYYFGIDLLVNLRWDTEQCSLQPTAGRPAYPYCDDELRKVARDAYVSWQGSRYSVPWEYAGKQVWVRDHENDVEICYGAQRIARHSHAPRKHVIVTQAEHHQGIPLGVRRPDSKTLVHLQQSAPVNFGSPAAIRAGGGDSAPCRL